MELEIFNVSEAESLDDTMLSNACILSNVLLTENKIN